MQLLLMILCLTARLQVYLEKSVCKVIERQSVRHLDLDFGFWNK